MGDRLEEIRAIYQGIAEVPGATLTRGQADVLWLLRGGPRAQRATTREGHLGLGRLPRGGLRATLHASVPYLWGRATDRRADRNWRMRGTT